MTRSAVALVGSVLLAGCVSSARIAELGDQQVAQVEQSMGILPDTQREQYVSAIGRKLAGGAHSDAAQRPLHEVRVQRDLKIRSWLVGWR